METRTPDTEWGTTLAMARKLRFASAQREYVLRPIRDRYDRSERDPRLMPEKRAQIAAAFVAGRLPGGPRLRGLPGPRPRGTRERRSSVTAPAATEHASPTEHQLEAIYRTSFDALLVFDDERRFLHVNESATTLLGAPLENVMTRRLEHFTPQEQWPALRAALGRSRKARRPAWVPRAAAGRWLTHDDRVPSHLELRPRTTPDGRSRDGSAAKRRGASAAKRCGNAVTSRARGSTACGRRAVAA